MPTIPTYDAKVGFATTAQPTATANTEVAAGMLHLGKTSQQLGNALADVRDRMQLTNAQLEMQEGMAELHKSFEQDTDLATQRERFAEESKALSERVSAGMSRSASAIFNERMGEAMVEERERFNTLVQKREFADMSNKIKDKLPLALNTYVRADNSKDLTAATEQLDTILAALRPTMNPEKFTEYRSELLYDAKMARATRQVEFAASLGKPIEEDKYTKDFLPEDMEKLRNKHAKRLTARNTALNSFIKDNQPNHEAQIILDGNVDTGFYAGMEQLGGIGQANQQREKDKTLLLMHQFYQKSATHTADASLTATFNYTKNQIEKSNLDPAAKLEMLNKLETLKPKVEGRFVKAPFAAAVEGLGESIGGMGFEDQITSIINYQDQKGRGIKNYKRQYFENPNEVKAFLTDPEKTVTEKIGYIKGIENQYGRHSAAALDSIGVNVGVMFAIEASNSPSAAKYREQLFTAAMTKKSDIAISSADKKVLDSQIATEMAGNEILQSFMQQQQQFGNNPDLVRKSKESIDTFKKLTYILGDVDQAKEIFSSMYAVEGLVQIPTAYDTQAVQKNLRYASSGHGMRAVIPRERYPHLNDDQYKEAVRTLAENSKWVNGENDTVVLVDDNNKPVQVGNSFLTLSMEDMQKLKPVAFEYADTPYAQYKPRASEKGVITGVNPYARYAVTE